MSDGYPTGLSFGPESRVVLIGTSENPGDPEYLPPLPQVPANIRELRRLLTDPDVVGLPTAAVVTMLDVDEPSQIARGIARAAKEATDTLVVYYVGHGLYGQGETPLYLVARSSTDAGKAFDALSINQVRRAMRESPARKRVLILDCCYSGRALGGELSAASAEAAAIPAIDVEGTYGIAAVPGGAKALAPPGEAFTRFTGALVDVLKGGVDADTPVLTLDQVFDEVKKRIHRMADAPLPESANWKGAAEFRLARNGRLRGTEIRQLTEEVRRLREQVTAAEQRIASIDKTVAALGEVVPRIAALETSLAAQEGRIVTLETGGTIPVEVARADSPVPRRNLMAERLAVPNHVWQRMPAQAKAKATAYHEGRRNGSYAVLGSVSLSGSFVVLSLILTDLAQFHAIAACIVILALFGVTLAAGVRTDSKFSLAYPPHDPEVEREFATNGGLERALRADTANILGLRIDPGLARLAGLMAVACAVILAVVFRWAFKELLR